MPWERALSAEILLDPMTSPETEMPVVSMQGVSKRYGQRMAVDGLDLDVPAGQCFGLLGPNGAGKTTTLRMIYGAAQPSTGTVAVFGLEVARQARAVRARLGVTLQDNVLIETATARENLRIFGRHYLLDAETIARRIDTVVEFLQLGPHADMIVRRLSGGFKRRLAIALSLMNMPELLILDEPTTGLDPNVRQGLWSRIRALGAAGTTVLITTHYMDEAERLCDRVVIMARGRAIADDAPAALIGAHLAREAIEFDCDEAEGQRFLSSFAGAVPHLRTGNRLMAFADDAGRLQDALRALDGGDRRPIVLRPANLEDVFLSLSGTRLDGDC